MRLSTFLSLSMSSMSALAVPRVLVFTATKDFRHDSIPTAIQVLGEQGEKWNVTFVFTEDAGMFVNETLSGYDGIMFVLNSGDVLDDNGQAALQSYFQSGGVYTGVHSASACLFNDTNYEQAVGALFDYHPQIQPATFERLNDTHPATKDLPDKWTYEEEVYYFRSDPRSVGATVLLTVDESSYTNNGTSTGNYPPQGSPHPIAWYIDSMQAAQPLLPDVPKAGRSFYTALGHLNSTWLNETFINHVMGGLTWALEGASTRAYGVGLVGNGSSTSTPSGTSSMSGSRSATSITEGASSGAASGKSALSRGSGAAAGAVVGAMAVGMALVL